MTDLTQFTLFLLIVLATVVPVGMLLSRTFTGQAHGWLGRITYKILGIDPEEIVELV